MAKKKRKSAVTVKKKRAAQKERQTKKSQVEGIKQHHVGILTSRGKKGFEVVLLALFISLLIVGGAYTALNQELVVSTLKGTGASYDFEVSDALISTTVLPGENPSADLQITNTGADEQSYVVRIAGVDHFVSSGGAFELKPGQAKIIPIQIATIDAEQGTALSPGHYAGSIEITNGVTTKDVLLSVSIMEQSESLVANLNPQQLSIAAGDSLQTELYFVTVSDQVPVDLAYSIIDSSGKIITDTTETKLVSSGSSIFVGSVIPQATGSGPYLFRLIAEQNGVSEIQTFSFRINGNSALTAFQFCNKDIFCMIEAIIVLLLVITVLLYLYFFFGTIVYRLVGGDAALMKKLEEIGEPVFISKKQKTKKSETRATKKIRKALLRGEKLLSKNHVYRAEKVYSWIMKRYVLLTFEEKATVFAEIDSFYTKMHALLAAAHKLEEEKEQQMLKEKREIAASHKEKEEQKEAEKKKEEEYEELQEDIDELDFDSDKKNKKKKKEEENVAEKKSAGFFGVFGGKKEEVTDTKDKTGKKKKEKKHRPVSEKKTSKTQEIRNGKTKRFVKCHENVLLAKQHFKNKNKEKAHKHYKKAWNLYIDLHYDEKKDVYKEILKLYKDLTK